MILRSYYSPGDIVMLTAAVRDLHKCHPGRFLTDVRTSCPEFWEANPYLTRLKEKDPEVELIDCECPLINRCNEAPHHFIEGFIHFLSDRLGLQIRPTSFKGDLHITALEKSWFSQVHELTGEDTPFWIVAAGGKYDVTIKWWDNERYQAVVDHFRDRIQFVQVGETGHHHPRLEGVIDLRGKTDLRELVRLVYHSQGVLCPVTCLMHLAAAIETKPAFPRKRPCVVIAGGREPAHWEAYPHHQFIHTIGALRCCANGGCWKDRVYPLGDGDTRDKPENLCQNLAGHLPRCMDMITPSDVIGRIEKYVEGGMARYLSARQARAAREGVASTRVNSFDEARLTVRSVRAASEGFIRRIPVCPRTYDGRGIVICGGGARYLTNAWVCIHMVRRVGCALPIELWHLGGEKVNPAVRKQLQSLGVRCIDASKMREKLPVRILNGWELKPYAILHSRFKQVLALDADNIPVIDPRFLFETAPFKATGALFWPNVERRKLPAAVWSFCGIRRRKEPPFETGQLVVDKERCWRSLRLCLWYNENSDFFYKHLSGRDETFHLAFRKLDQPYAMPDQPIRRLEGADCQHDFHGRRVFQHRNRDKWNLFLTNKRIKGFRYETACRSYVKQLRRIWDGGIRRFQSHLKQRSKSRMIARSANPEVRVVAWMVSCAEREKTRAQTLARLALTDWGRRPVRVQVDSSRYKNRVLRISHTHRHALLNSLRWEADYVLILEDDLRFNRFFWHNLANWSPLTDRTLDLGSLYNPDVRPLACDTENHYLVAEPGSVYGSQALLLSMRMVQHALKEWGTIAAPPDLKLPLLAAELGAPVYYHAPSLVQHLPVKSTWGGIGHRAADFDPHWKTTANDVKTRGSRATAGRALKAVMPDAIHPSGGPTPKNGDLSHRGGY
ncbi:MAG TPA: glycosyltransferase family 9 protein [Verrucomicrobiae bacterium]|nr:glycosyltransferase family 9 protein [Verrucomicrobiae bacterium]